MYMYYVVFKNPGVHVLNLVDIVRDIQFQMSNIFLINVPSSPGVQYSESEDELLLW